MRYYIIKLDSMHLNEQKMSLADTLESLPLKSDD